MSQPLVGILALQGCVQPHHRHFEAAGALVREIRSASDFRDIDGLLVPGGESTTMLKLLRNFDMEAVFLAAATTRPYWGVCAGAILAAREVTNPEQRSFGIVDARVSRNGYGRQRDSFNAQIRGAEVSFIRAPVFEALGPGVEVLESWKDRPVWVQERQAWLMAFHPELSDQAPSPFHVAFLELISLARMRRPRPSATMSPDA